LNAYHEMPEGPVLPSHVSSPRLRSNVRHQPQRARKSRASSACHVRPRFEALMKHGRLFPRWQYRHEAPRCFNTSKTFGFTTLMGLPAA
jgi:hypothetical protein